MTDSTPAGGEPVETYANPHSSLYRVRVAPSAFTRLEAAELANAALGALSDAFALLQDWYGEGANWDEAHGNLQYGYDGATIKPEVFGAMDVGYWFHMIWNEPRAGHRNQVTFMIPNQPADHFATPSHVFNETPIMSLSVHRQYLSDIDSQSLVESLERVFSPSRIDVIPVGSTAPIDLYKA
ncbi:hypothetical protein [Gordonia sp. CPCC 205333]|uniref:hypothetical protein n=1 Tax=Gordonia sp. CPCC 205333 TaxID=3140790 RepID=UPI003AF36F1F